ncbi:uncharacterized protein F5147DRAFT_679673 [Suillus discolor]|uniref:Hydrophobin n=1 Tax=Suillus discolor TaxID=1912936 RepID=A0A9P7FC09_9AGAM|nr:uncharacterized protein F5147DRAFT_679673 [Suillus discolor]KAG2113760.1 hypothetical protein F5147DRAFT_679673 [Suillus discolor]
MHLPSVVAVACALVALVSASPANIDSSGECPIVCAFQDCCPEDESHLGVSGQMNAMSTTVSRISTSISIGADDG